MGFGSWMKNLLLGKGAPADEEIRGLNFHSVIGHHLQWRQRLSNVIEGKSNERLSISVVGADDQCRLGKWLKGPIRQEYANNPEFQTLLREHARFHECAAQVLQEAQNGRMQEAKELLVRGEFPELSRSLCTRLGRLYQALSGKTLDVEDELSSANEEVEGLNFRSAVDAHMSWRQRLADVVSGKSSEQLSVAQLAASDKCILGKWLHGAMHKRYEKDPEFQALLREHARFHECAAKVLQEAQSGRTKEAQALLNGREFLELSRSLCNRLLNLYNALSKR